MEENTELELEAKRSKVLLFILLGLVVVVGIGLASVSLVGGSVLYYKTPTEVTAGGADVPVRLAGQLVIDSVGKDAQGGTTFAMTDGKTKVSVVYRGGATTALATASKPGTQMVAEGKLGGDGVFQATALMAKCPSKFATASPVAQPAS